VQRIKQVLGLPDWHLRYQQQAEWTKQQRHHIFDKIAINNAKKILDIGCGTGALEQELLGSTSAAIFPLDISLATLRYANKIISANWTCADACHLPLPDDTMDICLCHYLLLWLKDPLAALIEMKRITIPGGKILILAEPDYSHRIDHPAELEEMGRLQRESLIKQGADPDIGSSLGSLLHQAGIQVCEIGLSGGYWHPQPETSEDDMELPILELDLVDRVPSEWITNWKDLDLQARRNGERILYVPVFYAIGLVTPDKT